MYNEDEVDEPSAVITVLLIGAVALGAVLVGGVWAADKALQVAGRRVMGWTGDPTTWGTVEFWAPER